MNFRKFSSPYWYEIIALIILAGYNIFFNLTYISQVMVSVAVAGFSDFLIKYKKHKIKSLPKSGIVTGLLIGTVSGRADLYVFVFASAIAIISKNIIKWKVFNPAALGVIVSIYLFGVDALWWASGSLVLVFIIGYIVSSKAGKLNASFSFIVGWTFLILLRDAVRQSFSIGSIFPVFMSSNFFFAFLMITDPITSPSSGRVQMYFGLFTSMAAFILFLLNIQGFMLLALLISNLVFRVLKQFLKLK